MVDLVSWLVYWVDTAVDCDGWQEDEGVELVFSYITIIDALSTWAAIVISVEVDEIVEQISWCRGYSSELRFLCWGGTDDVTQSELIVTGDCWSAADKLWSLVSVIVCNNKATQHYQICMSVYKIRQLQPPVCLSGIKRGLLRELYTHFNNRMHIVAKMGRGKILRRNKLTSAPVQSKKSPN